jgi:hypothetical protein
MDQRHWFPKEKYARIKVVSASKPIQFCVILIFGSIFVVGIAVDPVNTITGLFLLSLGYFFIRVILFFKL